MECGIGDLREFFKKIGDQPATQATAGKGRNGVVSGPKAVVAALGPRPPERIRACSGSRRRALPKFGFAGVNTRGR
jgi:hypothetical protein